MTETPSKRPPAPTLPESARLPINRCNLPAVILGSLTFHRHPTALVIDGVAELHGDLFARLDKLHNPVIRAEHFMDYMTVHFRLESLEDAGLDPRTGGARPKADYLRTLRGWAFDPDSREGAVLKGWVESRFGLLPRFHRGPLGTGDDEAYVAYVRARTAGLYNTNALEAQLDLLYSFCQYELARRQPGRPRLRLYRGVNRIGDYEIVGKGHGGRQIALLNSLNSFTTSRERAGEFGDYILEAEVPVAKIVFFNGLLPGLLRGEEEYAAIGGIYELRTSTL